jgi:hypothetical protein
MGSEWFHADRRMHGQMDEQTNGRTYGRKEGRTGMTKLTVAFRNFANAPKNGIWGVSNKECWPFYQNIFRMRVSDYDKIAKALYMDNTAG